MKGHYVGDCPTNEDPEYDIPAGFDYVCRFCKERGTHYFLFCPRNPDPNSIYRRRQDRALQSFQSNPARGDLGLKRTFASSPESPESSSSATPSRSKIAAPKFSSLTADFEFFTKGKRISSREATTGGFEDDNDVGDIGTGMSGVAMGGSRDKTAAEDGNLVMGRSEILGRSEGDMVWERLKNDIQREYLRGSPKQLHTFSKQTVIERTAIEPTIYATTNQSLHADFLSKLFAKHPSQPNPKWRPRVTAIEMWDINDEKKRQEDEGMAGMSECEPSTEPNALGHRGKKNFMHQDDYSRQDSMDTDDEDYIRPQKQYRGQVDFPIDTKGFLESGNHEEDEEGSPTREEKVRAIQKKINSFESLRTKLALGEDVTSPEMEQMASGDLSQEELDKISRRVRTPEPPSPSGLSSSSSELSSPQRLSSSGGKRRSGSCRIS
jgi:hypothetical protein